VEATALLSADNIDIAARIIDRRESYM